ncbi:hypothetical protein L6452_08859 [Arctium lappa]|uniref:Uncharacterized protein n=1 Tax=Arctium lappa TaxID=4217 RepID=A0ACB9DJJ6_ARCLA|nr:hypothetical protein L6452_08859 [Arctium lappa]
MLRAKLECNCTHRGFDNSYWSSMLSESNSSDATIPSVVDQESPRSSDTTPPEAMTAEATSPTVMATIPETTAAESSSVTRTEHLSPLARPFHQSQAQH